MSGGNMSRGKCPAPLPSIYRLFLADADPTAEDIPMHRSIQHVLTSAQYKNYTEQLLTVCYIAELPLYVHVYSLIVLF